MSILGFLGLCMLVVTLVPLGFAFYRDWDYKRQISGKRKMRTLKDNEKLPEKEPSGDIAMDILEYQYKTQIVQRHEIFRG